MRRIPVFICLFFLISLSVFAQEFTLIENLNYKPNTKLTENGWKAYNDLGNNAIKIDVGPLFDEREGYMSIGLAAVLNTSGEDVSRPFPAVSSGRVIVAFRVNVSSAQEIGDYFLHLGPSKMDTIYRAKVFVRKQDGGINFGISKSSQNPEWFPQTFALNQTHLLYFAYSIRTESDRNDNIDFGIWNPSTGRIITIAHADTRELDTPSDLGTIVLRQGSPTLAANLKVDRIIISNTSNLKSILANFSNEVNGSILLSTVSSNDLPKFTTMQSDINKPSVPVAVTIESNKLTDSLLIKAPVGFEVAEASNLQYKSILKYPSNVSKVQLRVRLTGNSTGLFNGLLAFESQNREAVYTRLAGEVVDPNKIEITIQEARQKKVTTRVTLRALVTGQFGPVLYIQDKTAGIPVYLGDNFKNYQVGDSLMVSGTIQNFNKQIQLGDAANITTNVTTLGISKNGFLLKQLKANEINNYEGLLVTISGLTLNDKTALFYPDINYPANSANGNAEIRIDRFSELAGYYKPQSEFSVTGLVGRYKDIYQLLPRKGSDVTNGGSLYTVSSSIPRNNSMNIAAWNTNWFGSVQNGPTGEALQLKNIKRVLDSLKADVYVLSEVSNLEPFNQLVSQMTGFSGKCSDEWSGASPLTSAQRMCFLYKTNVFKNVSFQPLLLPLKRGSNIELRTIWANGRLPYMMSADYVNGDVTSSFKIVGLHARANLVDSDPQVVYNQRKLDFKILKDSLDLLWPKTPIIIAGDFNDDVDETVANITTTKESTFKNFDDDTKNYKVITKSMSEKKLRTYLTFDNVIDHIIVSDELFSKVIPNTEGHELAFRYINNYVNTTSDHLPVFARINFLPPVLSLSQPSLVNLYIAPNPISNNKIGLYCDDKVEAIHLYSILGNFINSTYQNLGNGRYEISPSTNLSDGTYFMMIQTNHQINYQKFLVH